MRIDSSGNVGIGTSSPGYQLNTSKAGGAGDNGQLVRFTNTSTGNSLGPFHLTIGTANYFALNPSPVLCGTNGIALGVGDGSDLATQRRMTIDASGNVLMGATSNIISGLSNKVVISDVGGNTEALGTFRSTTAGIGHIGFFNPNGRVGEIFTNGSSTTYGTSSDYRLKEDVAPMVGALDTVAQLKPVTYKWKIDGSDGQGFIAHELQAVVPDCVTGEKDAVDAEGNPVYQGIDTSFLVATLTAAIKEQQAIITDLKARIEVLENSNGID
jgi:hypothetical protein